MVRFVVEGLVLLEFVAAFNNSAETRLSAEEVDHFRNLCGSELTDKPMVPVRNFDFTATHVNLAEDYDLRNEYPQCPGIAKIRDQSKCGSCWAISATKALNDKICIATGSKVVLSASDTMSCASGSGCSGGQPANAWSWMQSAGVVTGGEFETMGSGETCMPYPFEECAHHVDSTKYKPCPKEEYPTPSCARQCTDSNFPGSYDGDKHRGAVIRAGAPFALTDLRSIMLEIVTSGPATAVYTVYDGMPQYKFGVYVHGNGQMLGGHAVEIIGYGMGHTTCYSINAAIPDLWCGRNCASGSCPSDSCRCDDSPSDQGAVPYWLIANSWNDDWGDHGTFKILRGQNECGIEQNIISARVEALV